MKKCWAAFPLRCSPALLAVLQWAGMGGDGAGQAVLTALAGSQHCLQVRGDEFRHLWMKEREKKMSRLHQLCVRAHLASVLPALWHLQRR